METVLVLTISGRDRSGLVEQLADVIAVHGGNWEHCRMAHLAGRFVGLLEVSVEELSTKTTNAPESGGLLFEARARLAASTEVDRDIIQANLEAIAQDLMVDMRWLD